MIQEPLLIPQSEQPLNFKKKFYRFDKYDVYLNEASTELPGVLEIDQKYLRIIPKKGLNSVQILVDDVIGVHQEQAPECLNLHRITINSFVKRKKWFRSERRYIESHVIFYQSENQKSRRQLDDLVINLKRAACNRDNVSELSLMIYFNPAAGSNSKKHFENTIDFLRLTNFGFDVLETKRKNHCLEHIDTLNVKKYESVVIISGDGLVHEFVNSQASLHVPVAHVPAGSANAFAKTQTHLAGEQCGDYEAVFLIVKGRKKNFNIAEFQLQKLEKPVYSFLSFEWALMADIDINSQFLRFLGGLRFELYALWRLIRMKRYPARFSFSNDSSTLPEIQEEIPLNDPQFVTKEETHLTTIMTLIPFVSDKYQFSPLLRIEEQKMDLQIVKEEHGRWNLLKMLLNSDSGSHFDRKKQTVKEGFMFSWEKVKSFRLEPIGNQKGVFAIDGERYDAQKVQCKLSSRKIISFV